MKSRIYKSLLAIMAVVMVIDWPVGAEAVNGSAVRKVSNKVVQEVEKTSFFRSCVNKLTGKTEEVVNKTTQRAGQIEMAPNKGAVGAAAARSLRSAARNNSNQTYDQQSQPTKQYQMARCSNCAGRGVELWDDMSQNICPVCNGCGHVMVEY